MRLDGPGDAGQARAEPEKAVQRLARAPQPARRAASRPPGRLQSLPAARLSFAGRLCLRAGCVTDGGGRAQARPAIAVMAAKETDETLKTRKRRRADTRTEARRSRTQALATWRPLVRLSNAFAAGWGGAAPLVRVCGSRARARW